MYTEHSKEINYKEKMFVKKVLWNVVGYHSFNKAEHRL